MELVVPWALAITLSPGDLTRLVTNRESISSTSVAVVDAILLDHRPLPV